MTNEPGHLRDAVSVRLPGQVAIICSRCGTTGWKWPRSLARASRLYCSAACYRSDRSGDRNPKWKGGQAVCSCMHCGASFAVDQAQVRDGRGKHCSIACKAEAQRIFQTVAAMRRAMRRRQDCRLRAGGRELNHHTDREWFSLLDQHGGKCAKCGSDGPIDRDHIIPLTRGGDDDIGNIQPLCRSCNRRKGSRLECR